MAYQILGIGAALVDTELRVSDDDLTNLKIPKGLMTLCDENQQGRYIRYLREHIESAHRACGGSAANSMIAASQLGCNVHMTCRVADDEDGNFFLDDLVRAGVAYNTHAQKLAGTTGKCLVLVTPDAERTMNTSLAISAELGPENIHDEIFPDASYLFIEGYLATSETGKAAAIKMRGQAQKTNTKISMSLSDPGIVEFFKPQLKEMLGDKIDMIFCNEAEAIKWTGCEALDAAAEALKQDAKAFAITRGSQGALLFDGSDYTEVTTPKIKAVDTNGAGDMFAGTFLAALCLGKSFAEAGSLACKGAAMVVSQMGPRLALDGYQNLKTSF